MALSVTVQQLQSGRLQPSGLEAGAAAVLETAAAAAGRLPVGGGSIIPLIWPKCVFPCCHIYNSKKGQARK